MLRLLRCSVCYWNLFGVGLQGVKYMLRHCCCVIFISFMFIIIHIIVCIVVGLFGACVRHYCFPHYCFRHYCFHYYCYLSLVCHVYVFVFMSVLSSEEHSRSRHPILRCAIFVSGNESRRCGGNRVCVPARSCGGKRGAASTDPDYGKEGCSPGSIPGGF